MNAPVVIIGTGLAGYNVAREFRKLDSETPLLLITADDGRSYSKPMLSTGFGKNKEADGLSMAEPGAMAEQLKAEVRTHTRVSGIDPGHKRACGSVKKRWSIVIWVLGLGAQKPCVSPSKVMRLSWFSRSTTSKITPAFAPPLPASAVCCCSAPA